MGYTSYIYYEGLSQLVWITLLNYVLVGTHSPGVGNFWFHTTGLASTIVITLQLLIYLSLLYSNLPEDFEFHEVVNQKIRTKLQNQASNKNAYLFWNSGSRKLDAAQINVVGHLALNRAGLIIGDKTYKYVSSNIYIPDYYYQ